MSWLSFMMLCAKLGSRSIVLLLDLSASTMSLSGVAGDIGSSNEPACNAKLRVTTGAGGIERERRRRTYKFMEKYKYKLHMFIS